MATPRQDLECQLCGKPAALSCGQCGGFFYCSRAHQVAHWTRLGHHDECARISQQVSRADDLRREDELQWLPWARRATLDVDEGRETRCALLRRMAVHGVGPYRRECACYARTPFGTLPAEDDLEDCGGLLSSRGGDESGASGGVKAKGDEDDAAEDAHDEGVDVGVSTWPRLYRRLGLPPSSPAALVLSTAATIYHALQITGVADAAASSPDDAPLVIHVLTCGERVFELSVPGAEKELDQLPAARALLERLLDGAGGEGGGASSREVHLHLVGPEVPSRGVAAATATDEEGSGGDDDDDADDDNRAAKRRRRRDTNKRIVVIHTHRGLYHEVLADRSSAAAAGGDGGEGGIVRGDDSPPLPLPPASLVVAPNAGLAAFTSWMPTLRALAAAPAPVVVTDFTEEAARMGAALVAEVFSSTVSTGERRLLPVARNPFRQPLSSRGNDNVLPTYSNGFTFGWTPTSL